jgi:threonine dehydrogenase-like Zn-dependent dehydrogenase
MRALAIDAPGAARVVERARPVPGAGEALVRVRRVGLCGTDLSTFLGKNPLVSYPRVIGHEIAGTIEAVGDGVAAACRCGRDAQPTALRRLRGMPAREAERVPQHQTLGVQREGALAEFTVVSADRLFTSASLSLDHLALVEPFCIGMHAVRRARVVQDDAVLVMGCGGVGAGAVAAAAGRGADVIAMDVDPDKLGRPPRLALDTPSSAPTERLWPASARLPAAKGPTWSSKRSASRRRIGSRSISSPPAAASSTSAG